MRPIEDGQWRYMDQWKECKGGSFGGEGTDRLGSPGCLLYTSIQEVQPEYLIPMHSFGRYEYYKDLEDHLSLQDTKLIPVGHEGQGILRIN